MESLVDFGNKVAKAVENLLRQCPDGNPTEEQIIHATKSAELEVSFEELSYHFDPVRKSVMANAYNHGNGTSRLAYLESARWWSEAIKSAQSIEITK